MDKATIIGMVLGIVLVLGAMLLGGSLLMFVDVPSILIVVGGTTATVLIQERMENVVGAMKVAKNAFADKAVPIDEVTRNVLRLAEVARRNGVLALEKEEVPTPYMKKGLRLLCDGMAADELRSTLEAELVSVRSRHQRGQQLFKFAAASAPSMGMIGTLVGLVQMLQKLDNPGAIGPSMAVALLTTLYGALIAFMICAPIAEKLAKRTKEETATMQIVLEGFTCIARGDNPMLVKEKLAAFLAPKIREAATSSEGGRG